MGNRAGDNIFDARYLGGSDTHDGRRDMRVSSAGYVTARGGHRNQLLAGKQARAQFGFEFDHAIALVLGKSADAIVGELDVVFFLL
jgi:hypothetical protein